MDLPTYTNIWRIEKRLYKLYDFRLPMPLPINWIAVFIGITLPYVVLLIAIGLPFSHSLLWLYVLPPGLLTWLTTRPVIEGKRLPELVESQVRYLTEPRTWVRLTPLAEKDQMVISARGWRGRQASERAAAAMTAATAAAAASSTASPAVAGSGRGAVARRGRAKARVPAVALNAAPVPVRDHGQRSGRTPRPANGQVLTPGSAARPRVLALGPGGGNSRTAPTLPAARPGPHAPVPQSASAQPTPAWPPVIPAVIEGVPVRARGGATGAPPLEVSHDRLGQHKASAEASAPAMAARPVTTLPGGTGGNVGNGWPSPARPLRPVRTAPASAAPAPAETAPVEAAPVQAASAPTAPAGSAFVETAPVEPAPEAASPVQTEPVEADPVEADPVETVPMESGPTATEAAPVEASAVETAPVETAPGQAAAEEHGPVEAAPEPPVVLEPEPTAVTGPETAPEPRAVSEPETMPGPTAVAEPALTEPAPTEPALVEQAAPESVPTEPVPTERASAEPALVEPAPPEPEPAAPEPERKPVPEYEYEQAKPALAESEPVRPAPSQIAPARLASAAAARATPPDGIPQLIEVPAEVSAPASPSIAVDAAAAAPARPAPAAAEFAREPETAAAQAPVAAVQETLNRAVPSIERALSGPAREQNPSWHGKVKIVTGAGASHGPGARDQEALDRNRARLDVPEPRRILVLGATSGAGQTVTALMTGYMLSSLREHPVAVVDLHDGTLARYRAPAAWLDEMLAGRPPQQITSSRPDGLNPTPKPSPARLDVIASHQQPRDGDEIKLAVQLNRHYPLTVLDPGPAFLTRLLKVTDQLVVVVPANAEAAGALADTRDWFDNNGHAELAMQSVTVINGVSRRSLPDVEHAESIARGRSRAIVRIPWDDMLPVAAAGPSTLRPQTRVAYTALAGVLVAGLAAVPVRKKQ